MMPAAFPAASTRLRQCRYWPVPVRDDTMSVTPLAAKSNGPPLTRKATLEIYTVARSSQDLPPRCFTTPPGGGFRPPPDTEHPQGCLQAPPGVVAKPLRVRTTPRVLAALPGGDSFQDARLTMSATLYLRYPTSGETGRSFRR